MRKKVVFLLACCTVLSCNDIVYNKVSGKWKINNAGLLLTSFNEEKEVMFTVCYGKNITIQDALISFDQPDVCFACEKGIEMKQHYFAKWKDIKVNNVERLLAGMGYSIDDVLLNKTVEVFEGIPVKKTDMDAEVLVLRLNEREIVIYEDSYYLRLKKEEDTK